MWYDVGLIATVAIGAWLALDVAMAAGWRRRSISLGILGGAGALWGACELLLAGAEAPWEYAVLRRLLYLAVCTASFAWYWVAVEADAPRWFRERRFRIGFAAIPLLLIYSCLYWAPDGTVISLYTEKPAHGPLWIAHALTNWGLIAAGLVHYVRAGMRLRRESRRRVAALTAGVLVPLGLNMAYAMQWLAFDPAPALLGGAALLIRFAVVDTGLAQHLPLAHSDVIEQLAVGVVVAGIDDRVIDSNASARRLLGEEDVRSKTLTELTGNLGARIEVIRFPLESHFSQTATAAVLTDRTEAVEAERRLQLAGRLEAIGSLTAGIAHEVDNPLAYIYASLGSLEKLLEELQGPDLQGVLPPEIQTATREGADSLADAREGFDRISRLAARLKGFARSSEDLQRTGYVDLEVAAERAAALASLGLREDAITVRADGSPNVEADDHWVGQILVNLMLNALQASGNEPHVEVDVCEREREAEVRVSDRGHGLDEAALQRIFDPFYTTRHSGTGLGLSISFDLARRLGGRIEAARREGGGATAERSRRA